MPEDLGRILKQAREEKGLSLADLQDATKIQKRYIEAIEKGRFDLLPGSFYTRAFIRSISDYLKLDTEQILKQYERVLPNSNSKEIIENMPRRTKKIKGPSMIGKRVTTLLLVAFVILIISIVYYFAVQNLPPKDATQDKEESLDVVDNINSKENQPSNVITIPVEKDEPKDQEEPEPPKPEITFVRKEGSTYYYTIANVTEIDLLMRAENGRCWYQIEKGKGKEKIAEGTLENGMEKIIDEEGLTSVYIRLGYSPAMKIEVNGQNLDLSGMPHSVRIDITIDQGEQG